MTAATPTTEPPPLPPRNAAHTLGRCSGCGYDLSGHALGVCPECAQPIAVHVENTAAAARLRTRAAWMVVIAGVAFLAASALEWRLGRAGWGWWNPLLGFAWTGFAGLGLLVAWMKFKLAAASGAPFAWVLMVLAPMLWAATACVYVLGLLIAWIARAL